MDLVSSTVDTFEFSLSENATIDVQTEEHMHALKISLNGDQMVHNWTFYKDGQNQGQNSIELTRT